MGSIPTRSRQFHVQRIAVLALILLLAIGWVGTSSAAESDQSELAAVQQLGIYPRSEFRLLPIADSAGREPVEDLFAQAENEDDIEREPDPEDLIDPLEGAEHGASGPKVSGEEVVAVSLEETPWYREPWSIMTRSLLFPGWGQWANGKKVKSAVVFGAEGYMIYRAVRAGIKEHDARSAADAIVIEEVPKDPKDPKEDPGAVNDPQEEKDRLLAEAQNWNAERRDFTWWTIFAIILSMGDAYVDAHLGDFDVEFGPEETGEGVKAALSLSF